jgi:hypothetical protein
MRSLYSLAILLMLYPPFVFGQSVSVRVEGDQLKVTAAQLRLLPKEVLDRLRNGESVAYEFQIVVTGERDGSPIEQVDYRYIFSYDLWEQKFAVTRVMPNPRAISHLSANAAEAWCLDALTIRHSALAQDRPFWVSLVYRREEAAAPPGGERNSGLTLSGLVDIFSRRNQSLQFNGSRQAGPFRLADLRRK